MSDLDTWLETCGFGNLIPVLREHDIDIDVLPDLTESDLEKLGLNMGQRKRFLRAIATLRDSTLDHGASISDRGQRSAAARGDEGERRQLTVMFCDLVGSTAMSTKLDPEELREVLRRYRNASYDVINRFNGYVARFSGDGILVYFGYPRAHEYDSERAIRTALHIVDAVSKVEFRPDIELQVRIGIATGLVIVGDIIGTQHSEERTVIGETPNLAARLQGLAEPNEVVISSNTRSLAGAAFQYRDKGRHLLKGFPQPMHAWAVDGWSDVGTRFEATHGASSLPLVDREGEIDWLRACWFKVAARRGQVVLVSGEAGFGKSRLVHSFDGGLKDVLRTRFYLQCSPYHANSAYFPIATALSRLAGFNASDTNDAKLSKLQQLVNDWCVNPDSALPPLAHLLAVSLGGEEPGATKSPERLKEDVFEALHSLLVGRSTAQPLLIVIEDAHWIDPTSWEFLERLASHIATERVLLIITFRPESNRHLARREHISQIELNRLSRDNATAVVLAITGGKSLPGSVLDQILAKTDGVPLFVEELTKMVLESNLLRDAGSHFELVQPMLELAIPVTLQDSLMARLDRLAPVKEVAQVGAVLGREFDYELLQQVVSNIELPQLDSALENLAEAELLFAVGKPPRSTYTFKHALVQDAAYASMLHSKRRALHAKVAEVLESMFPERVFMEPELIARHCEHGGLNEQAIVHWSAAGRRALERSAVTEALAHAEKGLTLLPQLFDTSSRAKLELTLETLRGWASIAAHGYTATQTGRAFNRARELCDSVTDNSHLFSVLYGQWLINLLQARVDIASEIAQEMLAAANGEDDASASVAAHRVQGTSAFWLGQFQSARSHLEQALANYETSRQASSDVTGMMFDVRVVGLDFLSLTLLPLGYHDAALEHSEQALGEAHASGALVSLAVVLQHGCLFHQLIGDADKVRDRAAELLALSKRESYPFWQAHANFFDGWATTIKQPTTDSVRHLAQAHEAVIATGSRLFFPYYCALLAQLYGQVGELDRASEFFELALSNIATSHERWFEAEVFRLRGELRAGNGTEQRDEAINDLRQAINIAQQQGAKLWELRAATTLAGLLHEAKAHEEARSVLEPIVDWYRNQPPSVDFDRAQQLFDSLAD